MSKVTPWAEVEDLRREVADLKLQLVAWHDKEKARVKIESRLLKRMKPGLMYPEGTDMLTFLISRGHLPPFGELTERQQRGLIATIGIGCGTNGVYDALRKSINHEHVSKQRTYQV